MQEKYDRLSFELESLTKDVSMEQDKLTSTLLTLVSRENRYAESVLHLIRLKKQGPKSMRRILDSCFFVPSFLLLLIKGILKLKSIQNCVY